MRNNPTPATRVPVVWATCIRAGARRSAVMAAATSVIMRRSMIPIIRRIIINPKQHWLQWRPNRSPSCHAVPMPAGIALLQPSAWRQQASCFAFHRVNWSKPEIRTIIPTEAGTARDNPGRCIVAVANAMPSG